MFIWNKIQHTIANNYIGLIAEQRHAVNISMTEFNICITKLNGICFRELDHLLCKINSDYTALFANNFSCNKCIITGATAKINYSIAFFYFCKLCWYAATQ